jgi:hypothetical protein
MIDLATEHTFPATEAPRHLPRRAGKPIHFSTIWRWILKGVKTPTGVVRLEAVRVGSRWVTSQEAIARFCERLTPRLDSDPSPTPRSPAARTRASERAAAELERLGI